MSEPTAYSTADLSIEIRSESRRLGFSLVGLTPAVSPGGFSHLVEWLRQGFHGEMAYIPRREAAYEDPQLVLDGAKSVIALGMNYHAETAADQSEEAGRSSVAAARVARYASGRRDYHDLIRERLKSLVDRIHAVAPRSKARGVVDTAPLLERDFARSAGLGWFGKNTMLINKRLGSWFFLAAVLLDVELDYDAPHGATHCGTCTRCLEACPTDAFAAPYVLDARKCISYLTIELRGSIDEELRSAMGDWVLGCDICQEVCPWNRKAPATDEPAFHPRPDFAPADALELLTLSEDEFRTRFAKTPFERPGWTGIRRNAAIAIGNTGDATQIEHLSPLRADSDPIVRDAVEWAISRLSTSQSTKVS